MLIKYFTKEVRNSLLIQILFDQKILSGHASGHFMIRWQLCVAISWYADNSYTYQETQIVTWLRIVVLFVPAQQEKNVLQLAFRHRGEDQGEACTEPQSVPQTSFERY